MVKIVDIRFTEDHILGIGENGKEYRQSLLWHRPLLEASDDVRRDYTIMKEGIFWNRVDVQISFESFEYPDAEPTRLQHFFLTHPEINVSGFAKRFGLNSSLLRNYINGFKTPSPAKEKEILDCIVQLGREYIDVFL